MAAPAPSGGANNQQKPIIIIKRRRKADHGGHHGGAWKVAYADFVTAMMAFFLLLWLLNVTTSEQRQGIADYFSPASVSRTTSGSGGVFGGLTITVPGALISPGAPIAVSTPTQTRPGEDRNEPQPSDAEDDFPTAGDSAEDTATEDAAPGNAASRAAVSGAAEAGTVTEKTLDAAIAEREARLFEEAEKKLFETIGGIPELAQLAESIVIDQTPEGLRIQIMDQANHTMFPLGSSQMSPQTGQLLGLVARAVEPLPNRLSISGHTDSTRFAKDDVYGNWELSAERANASRRALIASGIAEERIATVVGRADREPFVTDQPDSPRNRRISIVLLRERPPAVP
ncbi:flagellar motor protein MotB [Arenibaculum sp.]|jgi:chemotaxis protein MotB|uniref:flagellar motor protein MotB n=1 Tax=Arenibaculum sp. TaxID=2865862 RepID=UPI002E0DAAA0|nr:flagellar motor protein MotB [Arenibaculum sp.]